MMNALNEYVRANKWNIYHVDELHRCRPNVCTFVEPLGDGLHFVCMSSLRTHVCSSEDSSFCVLEEVDHNTWRCALTSKEFYRKDYQPIVVGLDVPLLAGHERDVTKTRSKDGMLIRFHDAVGEVLGRLYDRDRRRSYNGVFFRKKAYQMVNAKIRENDPNCSFVSLLRHTFLRYSSEQRLPDEGADLSQTEMAEVTTFVFDLFGILITYSATVSSRKDFLLTHCHETVLYLLKRTLYGIRSGDAVILQPRFSRLKPLPGDRLLPSIFQVTTSRLTECSSLLQSMMTEKICLHHLSKLNP